MRIVAIIAATVAKLCLALLILALGWMILSPARAAHWPLAPRIEPLIERGVAALPAERVWWGVLVLALGAGAVLAALPKKAAARSNRRAAALDVETGVEPVPIPVASVDTAHETPVLATVETPTQAMGEAKARVEPVLDYTSGRAPWDFFQGAEGLTPVAAVVTLAKPEPAAEAAQVSQQAAAEPDAIAPVDHSGMSHEDELAEARGALAEHPGLIARSRLADLLKKSGDIEEAEGRLGPAIDAYEQSVALRREVVAEAPDSARETRWLWMTLETLAECRDDRGHHSQAAALYRESLTVGERALALAPDEASYANDLNATRARLASLEAQTA